MACVPMLCMLVACLLAVQQLAGHQGWQCSSWPDTRPQQISGNLLYHLKTAAWPSCQSSTANCTRQSPIWGPSLHARPALCQAWVRSSCLQSSAQAGPGKPWQGSAPGVILETLPS